MTRRALLPILFAIALAPTAPRAHAQVMPGPAPGMPARQVTLFGILATPGGGEVDPKLRKIEPQLRKLFPNGKYSFKLLASESKRLGVGQTLSIDLGEGFTAGTQLLQPLDGEGNIQMRFELDFDRQTEFATIVRTPPNQLFFCDKALPGGQKLLIGLGGR